MDCIYSIKSKENNKRTERYNNLLEKYKNVPNLDVKIFGKDNAKKILIKQTGREDYPKDKIYYVYLGFDWKNNFKYLVDISQRNGVVSLGINLPITKWYFGKSTKSIQREAYNEIESLIKKGIPSKNIIIDGLCITSAIGTRVVKKLYDEGKVVNLFNDRSFDNLKDHFSKIREENTEENQNKNTNKYSRNLLNGVGYKILDKCIVPMYAREFKKVGDEFAKIYKANPDRINYVVYKPVKDEKGSREFDKTIPHKNSIHKNYELKNIRILSKKPAKDSIEIIKEFIKNDNNLNVIEVNKLINNITLKKQEYVDVKYQESNIRESNIELFDDAINLIKKYDFDSAIEKLKLVCFCINSNHKYEKLYSDEESIKIELRKTFRQNYHKFIKDDPNEINFEKEFKTFLEKGYKKKISIPRGHVIGRHLLYSRLCNITLNMNENLEQDKVKTWIKDLQNGELIIDDISIIDLFISNIKELNKRDKNHNNYCMK